MQLESNDSVS